MTSIRHWALEGSLTQAFPSESERFESWLVIPEELTLTSAPATGLPEPASETWTWMGLRESAAEPMNTEEVNKEKA